MRGADGDHCKNEQSIYPYPPVLEIHEKESGHVHPRACVNLKKGNAHKESTNPPTFRDGTGFLSLPCKTIWLWRFINWFGKTTCLLDFRYKIPPTARRIGGRRDFDLEIIRIRAKKSSLLQETNRFATIDHYEIGKANKRRDFGSNSLVKGITTYT